MKILHIVSNISIRNGVMSVVMNYYRNIDRKNISFSFLYFDETSDTYQKEIEKLGGSSYRLKSGRSFFKILKEIRKYINNNINDISIIHLHEVYLVWSLLFLKKKIKIIIHAHATKFSENRLKNIRNRVVSFGRSHITNYLFACSKDAGEYIFGNIFRKKGWVMNNAIDSDKFTYNSIVADKLKKQMKIQDKFVVGHIGNFNEQKNHDFLIDIFHEIVKEDKNSILLLVGDGKNRFMIEKKCRDLNLMDNVIFLGIRNDVNIIIQSFDAFVLPSKYEGLGIVLIEAQAAGIPCVFSDVVPKEANILDSNIRVSLKKRPDEWAYEILKFKNFKKKNTNLLIKNNGYDIRQEAKKLCKKYESIIGGDKE